jgi:hypothetical protein
MTSTRDGNARRRPILIPVVALLAAAGLAVTAVLGGLNEAPSPVPEQLGKGDMLDQGEFSTEFGDAVVRRGGQNDLGVSDKRYLQIALKVTNETDETVSAFSAVDGGFPVVRADGKPIKYAGQDIFGGPRIVVTAGGKTYNQLHPKMPATVVMSFELAAGQAAPKKVQLDAAGFEWHQSFIDQTHAWQVITKEIPLTAEDRMKKRDSSYVPVVSAQINLPVREEGAQ